MQNLSAGSSFVRMFCREGNTRHCDEDFIPRILRKLFGPRRRVGKGGDDAAETRRGPRGDSERTKEVSLRGSPLRAGASGILHSARSFWGLRHSCREALSPYVATILNELNETSKKKRHQRMNPSKLMIKNKYASNQEKYILYLESRSAKVLTTSSNFIANLSIHQIYIHFVNAEGLIANDHDTRCS